MVLLLTIGTIVLAVAVVTLVLERNELKESLETQKTKVTATISYAEDLANTIADLKQSLEHKNKELINCRDAKAASNSSKSGRPRKNN
jgi:predicted Holliday junction resolvase-like endonuclease